MRGDHSNEGEKKARQRSGDEKKSVARQQGAVGVEHRPPSSAAGKDAPQACCKVSVSHNSLNTRFSLSVGKMKIPRALPRLSRTGPSYRENKSHDFEILYAMIFRSFERHKFIQYEPPSTYPSPVAVWPRHLSSSSHFVMMSKCNRRNQGAQVVAHS